MEINKYSLKNKYIVDKLRNIIKFSPLIKGFKFNYKKYDVYPVETKFLDPINNGIPFFYQLVPSNIKNKEEWYNLNKESVSFPLDKYIIKYSNEYKSILELLYDNPFLSGDIMYQIEKSNIKYEKYEFDNILIENYIIDDKYKVNINRIYQIVNSVREITQKYIPIRITFALSTRRKILPDKNEPLTTKNVNSACCLPSKYIRIWRYEEHEKILFHELIHFFHVDTSHIDYDAIAKKFCCKFGLLSKPLIYEGVCELLALVLHYSFFDLMNINNKLEDEMIHGIIQWLKIEKNYDDGIIKQKSNALSYYYIKLVLLSNINLFMSLINDNLTIKSTFNLNILFDDKYLIGMINTIKPSYLTIYDSLTEYQRTNLRMALIQYV